MYSGTVSAADACTADDYTAADVGRVAVVFVAESYDDFALVWLSACERLRDRMDYEPDWHLGADMLPPDGARADGPRPWRQDRRIVRKWRGYLLVKRGH